MTINYFWHGMAIDERKARALFQFAAQDAGRRLSEIRTIWSAHQDGCEGARDLILALCEDALAIE